MAKQYTVNKVFTDTILNMFPFTSHGMRWGNSGRGVPGLNQKFKKWDNATHEPVADAAALRLVTAVDRAASMIVPMAGATPEIYVFSATNTDADDGVTIICPADITHPAPGRWVMRSEATSGGTTVTMASAAAGADYIVATAGANRTVKDSTIATANIATMAAPAAGAGNLIQSAGADKTQSDSSVAVANLVVNSTGAAGAAERILVSAGADKTAKATSLDYRYNFPRILVSSNLTIGVGGSTETAFAVPPKCLIRKGWFEVITPVAGQTVDLGVTGYDLDGIIAAGSVNAAGYIDGPLGVLMPDDFLVSAGLNFCVTGGAAAAGAVVKAFVEIVEMA